MGKARDAEAKKRAGGRRTVRVQGRRILTGQRKTPPPPPRHRKEGP